MQDEHTDMIIIGRAERIRFFEYAPMPIPAKVDTGADVSSVWASKISENQGTLQFVLFDEQSPYYTGQIVTVEGPNFHQAIIANSFGHREKRYVVKIPVEVMGKKLVAAFTLANRSQKIYPVLLGRRLLTKHFLVDVTKGEPLLKEERAELKKLRVVLKDNQE